MKAITIWQPWASLISCGAKKYETRGWLTNYRGPIAIHAALKGVAPPYPELRRALDKYAEKIGSFDELPRGAIIATAELVDIWKIEKSVTDGVIRARKIINRKQPTVIDRYPTVEEMALGDWHPGRYAWELVNVKILSEPIPIKGNQGLWNWEPDTEG